MSPRVKAYIYLTLATFIWGIAAIVIKLTLKGISPLPFLTYRFFIAGILGIFFVLADIRQLKNLLKNKRTFLLAIIYSLLATTFALGVLFLGLIKTTVLDLALVDLLVPVLIGMLGIVILKEHITKREKLGSLIAICGAFLTVAAPIFITHKLSFSLVGDSLLFAYIFFDALSIIILKILQRQNFTSLFMINFSFVIAFLSILPIVLTQYSLPHLINIAISLPLPYQVGVFFMALISGSLAYYFRGLGQKSIEVSEAGLFGYLISVFAAPLAIIILGEQLTIYFVLGAIIVVAGIIIAESKRKVV